MERRNVGLLSLTENIETKSAAGKLIFHVFASLAEFERNLIRERTRAGLDAARARGSFGGRKPKLGSASKSQPSLPRRSSRRSNGEPAMK